MKLKLNLNLVRCIIASVISGLLLVLAFAPFSKNELAWFALVPLWIVCRYASVKRAALFSLITGATVFLGSIYWLINVTFLGFVGLSLYCGLYFVPFGVTIAWGTKRIGTDKWRSNFLMMILATCSFSGFEFLRGIIFTGFAWNPLAVTQYANLTVMQLASLGGASAVSALIVWMNAAIGTTIVQYIDHRRGWCKRAHFELMSGFMAVALSMAYGWRTMYNGTIDLPEGEPFKIAMVQPATPKTLEDWSEEFTRGVYNKIEMLANAAIQAGEPDMLIFAETAIPGLWNYQYNQEFVNRFTSQGVPVLTGIIVGDESTRQIYNSSVLISEDGFFIDQYSKQHLVIFGEYIPFAEKLSFLKFITPIDASFTPGENNIKTTPSEKIPPFSFLICFEDTVAKLARDAVNNGATWLINQSDDAWFNSKEAVQHMTHSVLRAIENRVPIARCGNSGVTCVIDPFGRITSILRDGDGNIGNAGYLIAEVQPVKQSRTLYKEYGEWFGISCASISSLFLLVAAIISNKKRLCSF